MSHNIATGLFQMESHALPTGIPFPLTLTNRVGTEGLLETNLQGLVPDDVNYVTNQFLANVTQNPGNVFKVASLPDGFSNVILKARWQWAARLDPDNFTIALYQGKPFTATGGACSDGVDACIVEKDWSGSPTFTDLGYTLGAWNSLVLPIDESKITDRTDLWVWVAMDRHPDQGVANPNRAVEYLSWLVLEASFPISSVGEAPTHIDNTNGLSAPAVVLSNLGDDGFFRYCYRVVPVGPDGNGPSVEVSIENSPASLDSTDKICLTWNDITGATSYKVYRTCAPTGLGLGLIATVLPDLGACGGSGGGSGLGITGMEDDGSKCVTDCDEQFSEALCQGETTVTIGSKEAPTSVTF